MPENPASLPDFTRWPSFPFEGELRVKKLNPPVAVEPPRSGEDAADCIACNTPDDAYIWVSERWRVRAMDRPTGLPMVLILECRSHLDIGDLPNLLAAELGVMTVRLERAIRSLDGVARVHVNRWGDGSAHLHMWFLARPYGQLQLRGTFLSLWDDILPRIPEQQWRENLALVAAWLAEFGGRAIAEPPHIQWQSPGTFAVPVTASDAEDVDGAAVDATVAQGTDTAAGDATVARGTDGAAGNAAAIGTSTTQGTNGPGGSAASVGTATSSSGAAAGGRPAGWGDATPDVDRVADGAGDGGERGSAEVPAGEASATADGREFGADADRSEHRTGTGTNRGEGAEGTGGDATGSGRQVDAGDDDAVDGVGTGRAAGSSEGIPADGVARVPRQVDGAAVRSRVGDHGAAVVD